MAKIKDHRSNRWKSGDHLVICQRTGRVVYASECTREWTGLLVHHSVYEPKHPQLMVRAVKETLPTLPFNPESVDVYVGSDYVDPGYWDIAYTGMS